MYLPRKQYSKMLCMIKKQFSDVFDKIWLKLCCNFTVKSIDNFVTSAFYCWLTRYPVNVFAPKTEVYIQATELCKKGSNCTTKMITVDICLLRNAVYKRLQQRAPYIFIGYSLREKLLDLRSYVKLTTELHCKINLFTTQYTVTVYSAPGCKSAFDSYSVIVLVSTVWSTHAWLSRFAPHKDPGVSYRSGRCEFKSSSSLASFPLIREILHQQHSECRGFSSGYAQLSSYLNAGRCCMSEILLTTSIK